jgi:ParB-like chromosome segregation protein Spo0J
MDGRIEQTKLKIEWWALADIRPYENNPREHEHAVDKMAAVIREFGFRRPLLIRGDGG